MIPARRAISRTSPLVKLLSRIRFKVSGLIRTRPLALAKRAVTGLPPTSTMRLAPCSSKCVRSGFMARRKVDSEVDRCHFHLTTLARRIFNCPLWRLAIHSATQPSSHLGGRGPPGWYGKTTRCTRRGSVMGLGNFASLRSWQVRLKGLAELIGVRDEFAAVPSGRLAIRPFRFVVTLWALWGVYAVVKLYHGWQNLPGNWPG